MKILIVTPIFPPRTGGPATYVWELARRLEKRHKITIICFSNKPKKLKGANLTHLALKGNVLTRQIKLFFSVFKESAKSNVVYIQGPLVVGLTSTIASKLRGRKVLLKFVGDEVWEDASISGKTSFSLMDFYSKRGAINIEIKKLIEKLSFTLSDKIIVPSKALKSFLINKHIVNKDKIHVILNAVEVKITASKKHNKQLVFVGRLVPWKNIDKIIKATDKAREKISWKLVIIGEGPEELKLKKLVKKMKEKKWIFFLGRLSHQDTIKKISKSQKLILYSNYEGLSHTLIEAMLVKTFVIASDIEANREVLKDHGTLIKTNDVEALRRAINTSGYDVEKTQNFAKRTYNWRTHIRKLEKVLS